MKKFLCYEEINKCFYKTLYERTGEVSMEVYQYQNNGILKEFKGLSAVAIQEKCKNLEFSCQFLESDKDSFVVINAVNSISIFVADKENKYIPLKLSFQK